MGWMETCAVDERMRFVMAIERQDEAFAELCRRFKVSRKTGYKWLARYRDAGVAGLVDRSRAPLHHPQALTQEIAEHCLAARRAHPTWGPVKVRAWLERRAPQTSWPATSTIGTLFDREGLTVKRRLRRRSPPSSAPFAHCAAANDVWCIDLKGWFLTGDGTHVRRVRHNGEIKWQGNSIYISEALAGELVGLIEDEGGDFTANYGPIVLGVIAQGGDRLRKPKRHARGLVDNAARCPQGPRVQQQQT